MLNKDEIKNIYIYLTILFWLFAFGYLHLLSHALLWKNS